MTANAPYYQMASSQFIASTTTTPSRFGSDDEYDLSTAAVIPPLDNHSASYSEPTTHQISADIPMITTEENRNFAELLEAATTATGQTAQIMDIHDAITTSAALQRKSKRRRTSCSSANEVSVTSQPYADLATKCRRVDIPTDPQLQPIGHGSHPNSQSTSVPPSSESLLNDARTAGVHSAAALFRRSSEKTSRKYTRPPMSKLFMSLQLSPESFLQLQAQAKTYMLDVTFPERQNCVGNRGKGDTDMVKLRLFNCVRDFLDDGVGEHFFGEYVEKPGERDAMEAARALGEDKAPNTQERLMWPRDGNKIISLVTPLMRRMVTNERQRMYAIETRKGGAKKKGKEDSVEAVSQHASQSPSGRSSRGQSIEQQLQPNFDPNLAKVPPDLRPVLPSTAMITTPVQVPVAYMNRTGGEEDVESVNATNIPLSLNTPSAPSLNNINIFLVLAPQILSSGTINPTIKLDQKRICSDQSLHLTKYPWDSVRREIIKLLVSAKVRYPGVREHLVLQEHRFYPSTIVDGPDIPTDSLRELAAAANAMQGDGSIAGTDRLVPSNTGVIDVTGPETDFLPQYIVKTVGSDGWETIENAEQWSNLLERRGYEVWADGVVNVIVELVDVSADSDRRSGQVDVGGVR
jgi:hypothetical protein